MTNGRNVYYQYNKGSNKSVFCKKDIQTGACRELFIVNDADCELAGIYINELFYTKGIDPSALYFCNLNTGKKYLALKDVTGTEQHGKNFFCHGYEGDSSTSKFRCYNAKTNKVKMISKKLITYCVKKNKLYYVEYVKNNDESGMYGEYGNYYCRVIRSNIDGSGKKVLKKNIKIKGQIVKITSSYLIYVENENPTKKHKIKW